MAKAIAFLLQALAACTVERSGLYLETTPVPAVDVGARDVGPDARHDLDGGRGGDDAEGGPRDADSSPDTGTMDWLEPGATHRLRLDLGAAWGSTALEEFVVPVRLDPTRIDYAQTSQGGSDVRFRDPDGALLAHEIERWDASGESLIWVRVPRLDPAGDFITLYFGGGVGVTDAIDAAATWPDRYLGVYHLGAIESVDGRLATRDSTTHGSDGRIAEGDLSPPALVSGRLAGALTFGGADTAVLELRDRDGQVPGSFPPEEDDRRTYEAWFRGTSTLGMPILYMEGCCRGFGITLDDAGALNGYLALAGSGCCEEARYHFVSTEPTTWQDGAWHHAVFVADRPGERIALYVDGALVAEQTMLRDPRSAHGGRAKIGSIWDDSVRLVGDVDEVRISEGAVTDGWVRATYEAALDRLITYRPVQAR